MASGQRSSNWAFIVYPESAPDGWMDILASNHISCLVSPLHDPDGDGAGEHEGLRKPHYHVQMIFESLKSKEQVSEITNSVNGTMPVKLQSARGYARYLLHLDNPEKQQFPPGTKPQIVGDLDYYKIIESPADADRLTREMMAFVRRYNIKAFSTLADYAAEYNEAWFSALTSKRTLFIKEYMKSKTWISQTEFGEIENQPDIIAELHDKEEARKQ